MTQSLRCLVGHSAALGVYPNCPLDAKAIGLMSRQLTIATSGDPLGLGLIRPAPPPDLAVYDRELEDREYARSLFSDKDRAKLDQHEAEHGPLTIELVRDLLHQNTSKESLEFGLDAEAIVEIDARTTFKVFVADGNAYTRDELLEAYAFQELGVEPESVFEAQEIGVFPPRDPGGEREYVARDSGDPSEFVATDDYVRALTARRGATVAPPRKIERVVRTKVYVGKEGWVDFLVLHRTIRSAARLSARQIGGSGGLLRALLGGGPPASAPLAIESAEREIALREREVALREREAALLERESALLGRAAPKAPATQNN